ncbi:hypothetical protein AVEN_18338-1 [Araneus ventricosus]|uniref:Uncharacterized protein n=1 Tax=Araneus ventricosus TaxID=182803 RepID=A0A4Y2H806_ARAVE|nr:hypothetical protein AVEN_18338-1 [Araneus ventricosus]
MTRTKSKPSPPPNFRKKSAGKRLTLCIVRFSEHHVHKWQNFDWIEFRTWNSSAQRPRPIHQATCSERGSGPAISLSSFDHGSKLRDVSK